MSEVAGTSSMPGYIEAQLRRVADQIVMGEYARRMAPIKITDNAAAARRQIETEERLMARVARPQPLLIITDVS